MSTHSSFIENAYLKDFRQELKKIKSPFIQKIKASTETFHTKIKAFQQKLNTEQKDDQIVNQSQSHNLSQKYRSKQLDTQQNINQKQSQNVLATIQLETQKNHKKNKFSQLPLHMMKEWNRNNKFAFSNIDQVKQNFVNVFNKKLGVKKKQKKQRNYDFKQDQKEMLLNIFHQIQNPYGPNKGFASIQKIIQFFEQNELFYLFYNVHPNQLKYVLKDFARTKPDGLTQKQFLYLFFMDRPLLKDLSDPYQKIVHRKCILDSEGWQQLKKIFNTLDTFGNQTIHVRPFFQKIKAWHSNPNLIYTPVIEFPQIQRVYTLKKVVFDLEHKFTFDQKIEWKDIESEIFNFNHKQQPTLDLIFQNQLEQGTILLDSNYFLIDKKVIQMLKNIFQKCPKFSQFFVNTKFVCNEMLQNHDLKPFYKNPIRQKTHIYGGYINLEQGIRYMSLKAPKYIDLDQFLEYFSIKGPITNVLLQNYDQFQTSDQQNQVHDERNKMLRRIRSLQKLQKSRKNKKTKRPVRQVTDFQQFNLTKKQKQTIRQKKLKEMLRQKQQAQKIELSKKFKANPIPADLNPQRLKEQQKRMQMRKRKKLEQVAKRRQQDKEILNYLKANTKLFEPINKQNFQQTVQNNGIAQKSPTKSFTHKPVPWFVQQHHLIDKIQKQKSQRKQKIFEQARLKYIRSWNKLPDFFFKDQQNQNSAQNSIIQELKRKNYQTQKIQIKANPVPDFKSLHKQFEQELQRKKKMFQPTQIQQFRLTSPKIQKKQVHSEYLSPQIKKSDRTQWRKNLQSPPANKISTTKKTQQWMEHNKKVHQQKRAVEEQLKQKQKQRIMKQKNFAKFMSKKLREQDKKLPDLEAQTNKKLSRHKQTVKYLQKLTQKQLSQMYARVLQRPFLFETATSQNVKRKIQKKKKNSKKPVKKGVIKNIQPIDMSEQSTNKYNEENQHEYENDGYERNDQNESNNQRHSGLNQSF